jgi:hypothetical protein
VHISSICQCAAAKGNFPQTSSTGSANDGGQFKGGEYRGRKGWSAFACSALRLQLDPLPGIYVSERKTKG